MYIPNLDGECLRSRKVGEMSHREKRLLGRNVMVAKKCCEKCPFGRNVVGRIVTWGEMY